MNAHYVDLSPMRKAGAAPFIIEDFHLGEWYGIPVPLARISSLEIPYLPKKRIRVQIVYDSEIKILPVERDSLLRPTFPEANPLFNIFTQKAADQEYIFELNRPSVILQQECLDIYPAISDYLKKEYGGLATPSELKTMQKIGRKLGVDHRAPFLRRLQQIYQAVDTLVQPGEVKGLQEYTSLESLLQEHQKTGRMTGDCKTISTITTALATTFWLVSRRISGIISSDMPSHNFPYTKNGHSWSEVYIPFVEGGAGWFPVDAALRNYLSYREDLNYMLSVHMPLFDGKEGTAKMRIDIV